MSLISIELMLKFMLALYRMQENNHINQIYFNYGLL